MKLLISAFLYLLILPCAHAQEITIPDSINPPADHTLILITHAKGYQIYQCRLQDGQHHWQLTGPDATLFNEQGTLVGSHFIGPKWKYRDNSIVAGHLIEKVTAPHHSAVPWLLVKGTNPQGTGLFNTVSFINRINTQGGVKPSTGCNSNHLGSERAIAYQADYLFYSKNND